MRVKILKLSVINPNSVFFYIQKRYKNVRILPNSVDFNLYLRLI